MKLTKIWLVLLAALLTLSGCGAKRGAQSAPPRSAGGWEESAAPESYESGEADYGDGDGGGMAASDWAPEASSSPAPAAEAMADSDFESEAPPTEVRSQKRRSRERPGLGTVWGENRSSYVSSTAFFRANPEHPFAAVGIHYNDAAGVRAMAEYSDRSNWGDNVFPAAQRQLSVRVLDANFNPLPGTRAGGRTYVVGEAGQRYIVRVQNHTGNRVEVVATVDGLDVLDGRPGSFRKRGYVLSPWGTLDIEGFRRSDSTVAAFRFGSVEDSYASRKGQGRNVGVIGVAFFDESGSRWPWTEQEIRRRHDADPFPGRYADPPPTW